MLTQIYLTIWLHKANELTYWPIGDVEVFQLQPSSSMSGSVCPSICLSALPRMALYAAIVIAVCPWHAFGLIYKHACRMHLTCMSCHGNEKMNVKFIYINSENQLMNYMDFDIGISRDILEVIAVWSYPCMWTLQHHWFSQWLGKENNITHVFNKYLGTHFIDFPLKCSCYQWQTFFWKLYWILFWRPVN